MRPKPRGGTQKYDWPAIRADAEELTYEQLIAKYAINPLSFASRRSADKARGRQWPEVRADGRKTEPTEQRPLMAASGGTGTPASHAANLEPVPDALLNLPWVSYPKDPHTARLLAEMLEKAATGAFTKSLGAEAAAFFESHAAYLRAIADRSERHAAATVT